MTVEIHRCPAGQACRAATIKDTRREPAITTEPGLCDACYTHFQSCVHQLPRDWADLRRALGERQGAGQEFVKSTPTPAIPIATAREALMAEIVDVADRAAALVSDVLRTDQPTGAAAAPQIVIDGKKIRPRPGSVADNAQTTRHARDAALLAACVRLVEPNIDALVSMPAQAALVWGKPVRCARHTEIIAAAEYQLDAAITVEDKIAATAKLDTARAVAGDCDDCGGWGRHGQARALTEQSGIEIALAMVELHHRVRDDLGKTRLRHKYSLACPSCHTPRTVGRDDGTAIINCTACGASWTQGEYAFLVGLITEGKEMDIIKWLLAEGYSRLDDIQEVLAKIADDERINVPGTAVAFLIEELQKILDGHQSPQSRAIATDKTNAERRQNDEDDRVGWTANETIYRPPKRRKASNPAGPPPGKRIATSSLMTINEDVTYLPDATDRGHPCNDCNQIHAGECA